MGTLSNTAFGSALIEESDVELGGPLLDPKYTDDAAVALTIQDARKARAWLDNKQWALHWREADVLYQSPRTNASFEGSTVARANTSKFTVARHVNSLVPSMKSGIFYEMPPFLVRPRPSTSQRTAYSKQVLYGTLMDKCDFEETSEHALECQTNFGTVIVKAGWFQDTRTEQVRSPKGSPVRLSVPMGGEIVVHSKESDEVAVKDVEVTEMGMTYEVCELGTVLIDPTWKKPNKLHKSAKYIVHETYPTYKDLNDLREQKLFNDKGEQVGGYDIPPEEELKLYFFTHQSNANAPSQTTSNLGSRNTSSFIHHAQAEEEPASADPMERPLQMLERWDRRWVYTVLCPHGEDIGVLIRKEKHGLPFLPFFAANFWNIPNAGYGLGVGRLAGSPQRVSKGVQDAMLDLLSMAVNQMYLRDRGANAPTQQIRQRLGGIIDVDVPPGKSVRDVFGIMELPKIPSEAFAVLQGSEQDAQSTTGADEAFTQGSLPQRGGSSAARTATGAGGIMSANAGRIQGPVGHFVNGILLPFIELTEFMVKQRMPLSRIRETLGDELGPAWELDAKNFFDSNDRFECLAGAHLAAKKAMAQALPLLVQIFENAPLVQQLNATGYIVDVRMLLEMFMEVAEWKNARELIRRMTPEESQRYQAQTNQVAQKTQGQVTAIQARHQAKAEEIDQAGEAAIARDLLSKANDEAALWDERKWQRAQIAESMFAPQGAPA